MWRHMRSCFGRVLFWPFYGKCASPFALWFALFSFSRSHAQRWKSLNPLPWFCLHGNASCLRGYSGVLLEMLKVEPINLRTHTLLHMPNTGRWSTVIRLVTVSMQVYVQNPQRVRWKFAARAGEKESWYLGAYEFCFICFPDSFIGNCLFVFF